MLEFVHDLTSIFTGIFGMSEDDITNREVIPRLDFESMDKIELQELHRELKKAVGASKINSGIVAALPTLIFGALIVGGVGLTQGIIVGLIIFFVAYEAKRHEFWRMFFSSPYHFYKSIKARHLYISLATNLAEFGMFTDPFKMFKTSRKFAKANDGRKMNERRAVFELNLIDKLLNHPRGSL